MDFSFTRIKGGIGAARGFLSSAVSCGIKNPDSDRLDLALIYSESPCVSAGTFTTNKVKAAPVRVSQNHLRKGAIRAIVANSGNANACTGLQGINDANEMCLSVAKGLGLKKTEVGVCSTGVIGLPMPMMRLAPKMPELIEGLAAKRGNDVARAIITSDTHEKEIAISFDMGDHRVRLGGCVKGAGMICPSMATMLCFITTDANISSDNLRKAVQEAVEESFNRITIDGDMSTNDTVLVLANGASGMPRMRRNGSDCNKFRKALSWLMLELAKAIVRDGERVTKFVTVNVKGAKTHLDAKKVAEAVCKSALVKSSWNGGDPNWGRIIHAVGYSRARIREELIDISIGGKAACLGGLQADTPMDQLRAAVAEPEFEIEINLNQGEAEYRMYSSDLSPEYVDFNRSEYAYWKQARKDGLV
ncbi:bifunctional glutamate N-acetyltransferase/amino-acid acetyltransferase ArgJ [Luteolibacter algae]|uniref:Arginine biosynthesis bifunctional protein ArgJ n=1 Tax=Luteolibacter algae TaxID=454151 RepID=A0ABW5D6J2_9BACT